MLALPLLKLILEMKMEENNKDDEKREAQNELNVEEWNDNR